MNYDDPALRDHLAAEYALGTLRGRARRRFERLMQDDPGLRALVAGWEATLNPLAESVEGAAPAPRVWARIEARLGPVPAPGAASAAAGASGRSLRERLFGRPLTPVPSMATAGMWYCVGIWRAIGLGGAALAAALALYLGFGQPIVAPAPTHVAVLAAADGAAVLVARLDAGSRRLVLDPVALPSIEPDQALELWLLPPDGTAPRSLGLLPASAAATPHSTELPAADAGDLGRGALAVSLEPSGGSPTGQPTGPVLYRGAIVPAS